MSTQVNLSERQPGHYLNEADEAEFREYLDVPCCANCRYWRAEEPPGWSCDPPDIPAGELQVRYVHWTSECTRRAPIVADKLDLAEGIGWRFPITPFNVWCGEFERRTSDDCVNHDHRESLQ